MAVRLPNGRSPRQPLRTLCSLLPLSHHRPISLYSSIYPSTGPPHSPHPSHASSPPPFQARAASTPKGAALASKFRITSTDNLGVGSVYWPIRVPPNYPRSRNYISKRYGLGFLKVFSPFSRSLSRDRISRVERKPNTAESYFTHL